MRVAITASSGRLEGLEARLRALGHDPVRNPLIAVRPRTDEASRVAAAALEPLRWRLYPSRTAVEAWRALGLGFDPETRLGAVGPATAAALREAGAHVDLVARPATAAALAAQVLAHPDGPRQGEAVAVVQGSSARPALARGLRAGRVDVRLAVVYDREGLGWRLETPVDAIVVASPSGIAALPALVGGAALIVAIGPTTAAAARRRGWRVAIAAAPTAEAVAAALAREPIATSAPAGRPSDGGAP
ncbi:MAG: uroporphyrinogen-III synthase [Trueperaceae bacterium]